MELSSCKQYLHCVLVLFYIITSGINCQHNRICFIFLRYERLIRELFIHFYNEKQKKNLTHKFNWICSCCHVEATCGIRCLNFTRLYSYLIVNFLNQNGPKIQNPCHVMSSVWPIQFLYNFRKKNGYTVLDILIQ